MPRQLVVLSAALLLLIATACGPDHGSYTAANLKVIDALPVFPQAQLQDVVEHHGYYQERGPLSNVPTGWTTSVSFSAPAGVSADEVLDFYAALSDDGWRVHEQRVPSIDLLSGQTIGYQRLLNLERGDARVGIDVSNLDSQGVFNLVADHQSKVRSP